MTKIYDRAATADRNPFHAHDMTSTNGENPAAENDYSPFDTLVFTPDRYSGEDIDSLLLKNIATINIHNATASSDSVHFSGSEATNKQDELANGGLIFFENMPLAGIHTSLSHSISSPAIIGNSIPLINIDYIVENDTHSPMHHSRHNEIPGTLPTKPRYPCLIPSAAEEELYTEDKSSTTRSETTRSSGLMKNFATSFKNRSKAKGKRFKKLAAGVKAGLVNKTRKSRSASVSFAPNDDRSTSINNDNDVDYELEGEDNDLLVAEKEEKAHNGYESRYIDCGWCVTDDDDSWSYQSDVSSDSGKRKWHVREGEEDLGWTNTTCVGMEAEVEVEDGAGLDPFDESILAKDILGHAQMRREFVRVDITYC
ncbi:hypothetical protein ACMFMG_004048 [Clarireedia jacksonii]